ncbi:putative porin [Gallaecimonas sp. GXIMD4217]|uniref:putative porin n=1 Tax=Gallaecimonas sp. GXIMD4217 TaxID=3131927 RepID=UPI00311B1073
MKKVMLPLALGIFSLGANAATVQNEVSAGFSDHSKFDDVETWSLGFKHYLNPVNTDNGPYDLNGFLSQQSYVEADAAFSDFVDSYGIGGRFINAGGWVLGGQYHNLDPDFGKDIDRYRLEGGKYLDDNTLLLGYYQRLDQDHFDADTLGARIEHYLPLAGQTGLMLKGDISNTDMDFGDDVFVIDASGDYYLNKQWSVGGGLALVDADNEAEAFLANGRLDTSYFANTSYWFNPNANIKVGVEKTEGVSGFGWGVQGSYRF